MLPESELLGDFPSGPLDIYRKQASFSWKQLVTLIDGEEGIRIKKKIYSSFENDPIFKSRSFPNLDEERKMTTLRVYKLLKEKNFEPYMSNNYTALSHVILSSCQYDLSLAVKYFVTYFMYNNVISTLGIDFHKGDCMADLDGELMGSFALTEVEHGSNTRAIKAEAKFDPVTQEFVLNCANFQDAKCWPGALGKCATHSIIWAKLILFDGTDLGPHAFVTKIRDPKTELPYPGVIVGDLGKKAGLNGIDNGFVQFKGYRIPKSSLLNKVVDITSDGEYVSQAEFGGEAIGMMFAGLSSGRVFLINVCVAFLSNALTIGIRYAAVRRQFGPTEDEEWPIIEYQLMQCRLFPYLAVTYCLKIFFNFMLTFLPRIRNPRMEDMETLTPEAHAVSCAAKALASWLTRDAIQECREACGGFGYLTISGLPTLRDNNDANCTYEGDNNVLLQQTSKWLLQLWAHRSNEDKKYLFDTPLDTVKFLLRGDSYLQSKFSATTVDELIYPDNVKRAYKWLTCYLLEITSKKFRNLRSQGNDVFTARNKCQVFYSRTLSIVFIEHVVISVCYKFALTEASRSTEVQNVLLQMISLYGVWSLEKHLSYLYQGGYLTQGSSSALFKNSIIELCARLKPEAVSLVDAIAPPDFILNSVLGFADGEVYKHLEEALFSDPETFKQIEWRDELKNLRTKL